MKCICYLFGAGFGEGVGAGLGGLFPRPGPDGLGVLLGPFGGGAGFPFAIIK